MKPKLSIALLAVAVLVAACNNTADDASDQTSTAGTDTSTTLDVTTTTGLPGTTAITSGGAGGLGQGAGVGVPVAHALQQFDECDALLTWIRSEAAELVGPYGFDDGVYHFARSSDLASETTAADGALAFGDDAAEAPQAGSGAEFSTTNVQEAGVDEPDIVKTDGEFLYVLANDQLHVIDVRDGTPVVLDTMSFTEYYPEQLLLGPDRLYVLANAWGPVVYEEAGVASDAIAPQFEEQSFVISELLVENGKLRTGSRLTVSGAYVTARQVGDGARIVVRHDPQMTLPFVYPASPQAEERAAEANREVVLASTLDQWLPRFMLEGESGAVAGILPDCSRVRAPQEFSGMSTVSVLTLDMSGSLTSGNALSLFGAGETIYASPSALYAATFDFPHVFFEGDVAAEDDPGFTTAIHKFDITGEDGAEYVASGGVKGHLLNQFAMSEYDGHLRVAVTEGSPWFCCNEEPSVSSVHVLATEDAELVEVGAVGDLGVDETIFGVRFVGPTGYVVTFRQTDPLYVIDLADPTAPRVEGELKITGYSSYLHPVGGGLVVGVGQEATTEGRTIGTKVSLFDVSDPSDPREVDRWVEDDSSSQVEWDHKAFLFWAPESLAVVPVDGWRLETPGAVALGVENGRLVERARISQVVSDEVILPPGCETIDTALFEGTELEWLAFEAGLVIECAGEPVVERVGSYFCEPFDYLGISEDDAGGVIGEDSNVSVCWPEFYDRGQIRRSVVIGDILWTIGHNSVQANDLSTFEVLDRIEF